MLNEAKLGAFAPQIVENRTIVPFQVAPLDCSFTYRVLWLLDDHNNLYELYLIGKEA